MGWRHKVAVVLMLGQHGCPNMDGALALYGYLPLKPPSILLQPGTMLYSRKGGIFGVVCGPRASLGAHWRPNHSPTSSSDLQKVRGQHFRLEGDFVDQIKANTKFSSLHSISVTVDDASLVELNDTDVIENVRYRSQACTDAIRGRIANGYSVTMVSSGLVASLTYRVSWDTSVELGAKAKLDAMQALSLELGGGASCVDESLIRAHNLMIGIRDDTYLARVSAPDILPPKGQHEAILTAQPVKTFDHTPDAPVVPYEPKAAAPPKGAHTPPAK